MKTKNTILRFENVTSVTIRYPASMPIKFGNLFFDFTYNDSEKMTASIMFSAQSFLVWLDNVTLK